MISDIEDGKINCVITKDLSRLGRNYLESGAYIEIFLPEHNVRYIALNDGVDKIRATSMEITSSRNLLNDMYAIFRHVSVIADSWNNKNAFTTSRYWLDKLFFIPEDYQSDIVLSEKVWLDETYYSVMLKDSILNDDGSKLRGLSKNKICIGVATDKKNTVIITEGYGKTSQKMSLNSFKNHIKSGSVFVFGKEKTHRKLVEELSLNSEEYHSGELNKLDDFENPLDPVNHLHYLIKRFLYAHNGFNRNEIQSYLNLYAFVLNPPNDKLEKIEILLNFALTSCKTLRFWDRYLRI